MARAEEEQAIITMVRDFARQELSRASRDLDQPGAEFPAGLVRQLEELGLTFLTVPEECGGGGLDLRVAGAVIEELAAVCPGFAMLLASSLVGLAPLCQAADAAKARDLLRATDSADGKIRLAAAMLPETGRAMTIVAGPARDELVLSGSCSFVPNGGSAGLYTVFAALEEETVLCAIPAGSPGLQFSLPIDKLGLNVLPCCDATLDDVSIPADHVLARSDGAQALMARVDTQRHALIAAAAVGCMRATLREATAYAGQRWQGGQLIIGHDAVRTLLTDMEIGLEASRAVVGESLACPDDARKAILSRIHATEAACRATVDAVQVFGGYGYMRDLPVEKLMRDSQQLSLIGAGNSWLRVCGVLSSA